MKPTRKRVTRLMAFGPAIVMICVTAFVASGASVVGGATASTVNITGSVTGSASIDATPTGGTGATGCADEDLDTFETGFDVTNGCRITFATNYAAGGYVDFADALGGAAFFCSDGVTGVGGTRDCTVAANRVENVAANGSAIADDTVGLALTAVAGGFGGTDATGGTGVAAPDATPTAIETIWSPINGTARRLCDTTQPNGVGTEATCDFVVGADGSATTGAGDYTGQISLTTQSN